MNTSRSRPAVRPISRSLARFTTRPLARVASAAAAVVALATLSACYVVPVDPRTGQAYPVAQPTSPGGGPVTVIAPPSAAPPAPTVLSVRLYPVNTQASKGGMLTAVVVDNAGHGTFTVAYLGDTLQGESTRVDASYAPFGSIYAEVLGPSANGFQRSSTGRRGIANGVGSRGVNAQCEYLITGPGNGTGACRFSDGANYQMYFGA